MKQEKYDMHRLEQIDLVDLNSLILNIYIGQYLFQLKFLETNRNVVEREIYLITESSNANLLLYLLE